MSSLETGDLLFFKRRIADYKVEKSLALLAMRFLSRNDIDHVAVIIKDSATELPYVLEWGFRGITLTPFDERFLWSRSTSIELRRLQLLQPLSEEKMQSVKELAQKLAMQKPKNISPLNMDVHAYFMKLIAKTIRAWLQGYRRGQFDHVEVAAKLMQYEQEAERAQDRSLELEEVWRKQKCDKKQTKECDELTARLTRHAKIYQRSMNGVDAMRKRIFSYFDDIENTDSELEQIDPIFRSSALVAMIYQHLGLLPPGRSVVRGLVLDYLESSGSSMSESTKDVEFGKYRVSRLLFPGPVSYEPRHFWFAQLPLMHDSSLANILPLLTSASSQSVATPIGDDADDHDDFDINDDNNNDDSFNIGKDKE